MIVCVYIHIYIQCIKKYIYIYIYIRLHTYTVIGKSLFHYRRVYPIVIQHDRSSSSEAQHLRHSGHTAVTWRELPSYRCCGSSGFGKQRWGLPGKNMGFAWKKHVPCVVNSHCYGKWSIYWIMDDFPIEHCDFSISILVYWRPKIHQQNLITNTRERALSQCSLLFWVKVIQF